MPRSGGRYDLVVVGGGPAGSTLAGLVKKHAPERRVLLLERAPGPRHHIGESLLPGLVPVLKELGVFEKVDAAGFPRKIGANYVWGRDRKVWENDFNDVNVASMLRRHGALPERIEYAWQVRRSVYDEILLAHAESLDVEVRRGAAAAEPLEDASGRIAGVRTGDGRECRAGTVADCSGQAGFLSRFRKVREYNPDLQNVALYSYFQDAPWKYRFSGHPDKTKIFVCSVEDGWFWYIPIDRGAVSVGLVAPQRALKASGQSPEDFYRARLRRCREIWPLLRRARVIEDFDGSGRGFFVQSDWSYMNVASSGPGWLAAGDAAVFVDPILSSGVTLAHLSAHRAAYTMLSCWKEPSAERAAGLWADYARYCRESAAQFLSLALFWYGADRSTRRWWARAGELNRAWLPVKASGHEAFITVSAGLTRHFERLLSAQELVSAGAPDPKDYPFYVSVLGRDRALERAARPPAARRRLRVLFPYKTELVFAPRQGEASLQPVKRVRFLKHDDADAVRDALNPRRLVTRYHLELLDTLDGRTLGDAQKRAERGGVPRWWLDGPGAEFVRELKLQGVVSETR